MGLVIFPELRLKKYLVDNPDHRVSASRLVFDAFERELMSLDLTHVKILGQNENCSKQATEVRPMKGAPLQIYMLCCSSNLYSISSFDVPR